MAHTFNPSPPATHPILRESAPLGAPVKNNRRQFYSVENIAHNKKVLEYCRTSLCAVGGIVSGKDERHRGA